ncbi:MAG: DUF1761 domain-containing protein [Bacteroidota bacterium]
MAYLELLIAAVAAFLLGFGWYTFAFGKAWQAETGITDEQAKSGMAMTHGLAFLMMIIIAYAINYIINFHDVSEQTFTHGAFHGALGCALYALPAVAINYLYQKKSLKLYLIDAGYLLAFFALEGGVLAALKL